MKDLFPVLPVKLLPVKSILLQNETTDTLQARWSPVRGATGYRLTWTSAGRNKGVGGQGDGETGAGCTLCQLGNKSLERPRFFGFVASRPDFDLQHPISP